MARVRSGAVTKARHKKILKEAKGYFGSKHRLYRTAKEQVMHSRVYAYRDRRQNKRNFRKLWIIRINAACHENEISYSKFINGLNLANIGINRKMLSEIAIDNPKAFSEIVVLAKKALEEKVKPETTDKDEVVKPVVKKSKKKLTDDITKMTVLELRQLAKEKKIVNYTKLRKQELIKELS